MSPTPTGFADPLVFTVAETVELFGKVVAHRVLDVGCVAPVEATQVEAILAPWMVDKWMVVPTERTFAVFLVVTKSPTKEETFLDLV